MASWVKRKKFYRQKNLSKNFQEYEEKICWHSHRLNGDRKIWSKIHQNKEEEPIQVIYMNFPQINTYKILNGVKSIKNINKGHQSIQWKIHV